MGDQDHRPGSGDYAAAGAEIVRHGFGGTEMEARRETQAVAAAEREKAIVQARYIVAMQRPRDVDTFRVRLLRHCQRPLFAEKAEYAKPVGGQRITGPSIRFVESALQEFGNVVPEVTAIYEDDEKRIVRVTVTDLERNITYSEDATVEKFVERKRTKSGDEVIGERVNSYGDRVFKIRATEDDFANKLAAAVSKKLRNLGLRILPADIVEEAMRKCAATRDSETKQDPDAVRKALSDGFASINVMPSDLKTYLGHDLATSSPAELDELRKVFAAIRDGEATWQAALQVKREERGEVEPSPDDKTADKLKARLTKSANGDRMNGAPRTANGS